MDGESSPSSLAKGTGKARRIFERLRDEHGFTGGITIVSDYVREQKRRGKEVFVPLAHDPGHAQVDFGEAWAVIAGVKCKVHYFALDLPHIRNEHPTRSLARRQMVRFFVTFQLGG